MSFMNFDEFVKKDMFFLFLTHILMNFDRILNARALRMRPGALRMRPGVPQGAFLTQPALRMRLGR